MSTLNRLMTLFTFGRGRDTDFENYYGSLIVNRHDGVPSAAEARRDYEPVRRILDHAVYF